MMVVKTTKWDAAEHLNTDEEIAAYLEAAFEDGDPRVVAHALGNVARAKGVAKVATDTGISRAGLYKALRPDGDPRLTTLLGALKSLGMSISVRPRKAARKRTPTRKAKKAA